MVMVGVLLVLVVPLGRRVHMEELAHVFPRGQHVVRERPDPTEPRNKTT